MPEAMSLLQRFLISKTRSCVLFLLLWGRSASRIRDYARGKAVTITGATWGADGRIFDGTDDRISLAANAIYKVAKFTFECWYKPSSVPASVRTLLSTVEFIDVARDNGITLNINQGADGLADAGKVSIWFYDTAWRQTTSLTDVLVVDTWIHILATYDKVNLRLYINGVQDNSNAQTGTIFYAPDVSVSIGSDTVPAQYAPGIIGEVRVYGRALSAFEAYHNYLASRWRYEEI